MSLQTWVNQQNMGSAYKYACADCSRSNELIQASAFKNLYGTTYAFCSYCISKPEILHPNEEMMEWLNRNNTEPVETRIITERIWISNPNLREPNNKEDLENCLCPFCLMSESKETPAETFTPYYKLPACNYCYEHIKSKIELHTACGNNSEIEHYNDVFLGVKDAITNHGFIKLVTKTKT